MWDSLESGSLSSETSVMFFFLSFEQLNKSVESILNFICYLFSYK